MLCSNDIKESKQKKNERKSIYDNGGMHDMQ